MNAVLVIYAVVVAHVGAVCAAANIRGQRATVAGHTPHSSVSSAPTVSPRRRLSSWPPLTRSRPPHPRPRPPTAARRVAPDPAVFSHRSSNYKFWTRTDVTPNAAATSAPQRGSSASIAVRSRSGSRPSRLSARLC